MFVMAADETPHREDRQRENQKLREYPGKAEVLAAKAGVGLAYDQRTEDSPLNGEASQELVHRR